MGWAGAMEEGKKSWSYTFGLAIASARAGGPGTALSWDTKARRGGVARECAE